MAPAARHYRAETCLLTRGFPSGPTGLSARLDGSGLPGTGPRAAALPQVVCMSFFDIVLDFILMDAFEDLENPPSSVLAVLRNRWLSDSFKETVGGCPHSQHSLI